MPGSADRNTRIRMLKQYYTNNLLERHEKELNIEFVKDQLEKFYKDQGRTIKNFKRTSNTRREDIQAALEELEVLAI